MRTKNVIRPMTATIIIMTLALLFVAASMGTAASYYTISGTVTDNSTGTGIVGATVTWSKTGGTPAATTGTGGAYTITSAASGSGTLTASYAGYYVSSTGSSFSLSSNTTGKNFSLTPAGPVSGTVTDAVTLAAVSGATMSAPGATSVTTSASGAYTLATVGSGAVVTATYTNHYVTATATVPAIPAAGTATTGFNFSLTPAGTITGTVTNAGTGANVGSSTTVAGTGLTSVTTSISGVYSFSTVPIGSYTLTASRTSYYAASAGVVATITSAGQTVTQNLVANPLGAVSGTVTSTSGGAALSGVTVSATGGASTITSSTGTYTLGTTSSPTVPYGAVVTASLTGYGAKTATPAITLRTLTSGVNLTLAPVATVSGQVFDTYTGNPLAGATVSGNGLTSVTTDSNGNYSFSSVPYGTSITVTATNYVTSTQLPAVTPGANITLNFPLTPVAATVTGTVTNAVTGLWISGATVSAPGVTLATTAFNGSYTLSNVPAGTAVSATAAGHGTVTADTPQVAPGGTTTKLNFALSVAPVTTASPTAGTYTGIINVQLTASEPATIYYTLNGTTPTTSSSVYSGPIAINTSSTLEYFAVNTYGEPELTIDSSAYIINPALVVNVILQDYPGDLSLVPVRVDVRANGDTETYYTQTVTPTASPFAVTFLAPAAGNFLVRAMACEWLSTSVPVTIVANQSNEVNISLPNGDVNGDGSIGTSDYRSTCPATACRETNRGWPFCY